MRNILFFFNLFVIRIRSIWRQIAALIPYAFFIFIGLTYHGGNEAETPYMAVVALLLMDATRWFADLKEFKHLLFLLINRTGTSKTLLLSLKYAYYDIFSVITYVAILIILAANAAALHLPSGRILTLYILLLCLVPIVRLFISYSIISTINAKILQYIPSVSVILVMATMNIIQISGLNLNLSFNYIISVLPIVNVFYFIVSREVFNFNILIENVLVIAIMALIIFKAISYMKSGRLIRNNA